MTEPMESKGVLEAAQKLRQFFEEHRIVSGNEQLKVFAAFFVAEHQMLVKTEHQCG